MAANYFHSPRAGSFQERFEPWYRAESTGSETWTLTARRLISGAFEAWYLAEDNNQDRDGSAAHRSSDTKDLSWVEGAGGDVSLAESMIEKSRPDFGAAGRAPLRADEGHSFSGLASISEAASREAVARVLGCKCGGGVKTSGAVPALDASSNDFTCLSYSECGDGAGGGGGDAEELAAALAQVCIYTYTCVCSMLYIYIYILHHTANTTQNFETMTFECPLPPKIANISETHQTPIFEIPHPAS